MKFIKFHIFLVLIQSLSCLMYACENNIEIEYPLVTDLDEWYIEGLLDKGEKNLLDGNYKFAVEIFSEAFELCSKKKEQEIRVCRCLLDRSVAKASLGNEEEAIEDLRMLQSRIGRFKCPKNFSDSKEDYMANGKPILGENHISIQDCIKRTQNTVGYIKDILDMAPVNTKWKIAFITTLYLMEDQAIQCCRSGGVWKACLQPLLEKWLELRDWERECRRSGHWYLYD